MTSVMPKAPEKKDVGFSPCKLFPAQPSSSQEVEEPVVDELGAAAGAAAGAEAAGAAAGLSVFAASVLLSAGADSDAGSLLLAA
jgi:hypothetical protein